MKRLIAAAVLACGFAAGVHAGTIYGIAVGSAGSAGSSGCFENAGYSTASGGSFTSGSGFDNPDYTGCTLGTGGPSLTSPGATAASVQTSSAATGLDLNTSTSGQAFANLATGQMNLFADANAPSTLIGMSSNSSASMWDTITVNGLTSTPQAVVITLTLDGSITGNPGGDSAVMSLFVNQGDATGSGSGSGYGQCEWAIGLPTESSAYGCFNDNPFVTYTETDTSNYGTNGDTIAVTISAVVDLTSTDNVFGIFSGWSETANVFDCIGSENSGCGTTNTMNFLDTGQFSISVPNGTSFTSASGQFLTAPPSGVPEPATLLLCGLGLSGIGVIRRRRAR